ncbi:MAG: ABC transporter ATP-binding protein [Rubrivivax sp.]
MLEVHHLQVAYGAAPALWGVSLELRQRELLCVVGPNGAGKTTLINTLAGVLRAKAGRIVFEGRDITALPAHRWCEAGIALVPEGRRLFGAMSVQENLEIGSLLPAAKAKRAETLAMVLALFPALKRSSPSRRRSSPATQQQIVAVARALMAQPRLLLLDEPSLGLSPLLVDELFSAIARSITAKLLAVLLVEQNVATALRVADRAYVLEEGSIAAEGTPDELMLRDEISAYLGYGEPHRYTRRPRARCAARRTRVDDDDPACCPLARAFPLVRRALSRASFPLLPCSSRAPEPP